MIPLLRHQVRRFLGSTTQFPENLKNFLRAIDETYQKQEQLHRRLEEQLETMARELADCNQLLSKELRQRVVADRRLEHSLSMFRATLESTADGILVVDSQRRIESFNRQFLEMWSLEADLLDGEHIENGLAEVSHQLAEPQAFLGMVVDLQDSDDDYTGTVELRDGRAFEVCCRSRFVAGCSVGRVWSFRDLTERRQAEHRQAEAEALRALNRAKDDLLDTVAHELRTPLTSIRSYSELLLTYDDPAVRNEFLQVIVEESSRLGRLVSNVLDLRKIELGQMAWSMEVIDMADLLERITRAHQPIFATRHLRFDCELAPDLAAVIGDEDRLRQVMDNLLNNALKFTTEGSVGISAHNEGKEVVVLVRDTGAGIHPKDQERIFARFQQGGSVLTGKPYGTGLGLAICREIVNHLGGRIWVESEAGKGSVFGVSLPATQSPPGSSSRTGEPRRQLAI
ncbi:MAG: PAS domain S-box protein [Chloroflexi bacterium]|nr:PAS domain S-box protein [Chloroflexota bacterium]